MKKTILLFRVKVANILVRLAVKIRPKEVSEYMRAMEDAIKYGNRLYWDKVEHSANIHPRALMLSGYDKSWRKKWDNIKFRIIKFLAGE